ncbi:MAG: CYTH domain-containing protein [bacterium]|nr:CYTH domain-containing protein [bacterium]
MIEIEKKFLLTPAQEKRLKKGAKFLGEKVFTDTYFDKHNYELTKNDIWLRMRDKQVELKMPLETEEKNEHLCNRYEEFTAEEEVRQMLNIPKGGEFLIDLKTAGYVPFVTITTRREKFKKEQFNIDIDACDFGYALAEVELLIDDVAGTKDAEKQIVSFASKHDLKLASVRGKVVEYLFRQSPVHYQILLEEGVVIE